MWIDLRRAELAMHRRLFLSGLLICAGTSASWPQSRPGPRLAFVHSAFPAATLTEDAGPFWVRRFFAALRRQGLVERSNLVVDRYSANGDPKLFGPLAVTIAASRPDLIVANYNPLVAELKRVNPATPILGILSDPLRSGLVGNLSRPESNVTGVSVDAGVEVWGKRLELGKRLLPTTDRAAALLMVIEWERPGAGELRQAAERLGMAFSGVLLAQSSEQAIKEAFGRLVDQRVQLLVVSASGDLLAHKDLIVGLARSSRIATMYPYRDYTEAGGLVAYAPDLGQLAEHLAEQTRFILSGLPVSAIPILQPSNFEFVLNLKAAQDLGIRVAAEIIASADLLIE